MFKVSLFTVGSIPKGPFQEIAEEFQKRLGKFCDYVERPFKDEQKLVEAIPSDSVLIVLDALGKELSSEALAGKLSSYIDAGDKLVFILGGPHGLSDELKKRAHLCLSLSQMTTTHDLAHVFFLEQLYRGFTIVKRVTYHY
ncbi:MAG: 23S rRNA (pseudouridine(1915)-N(3))-methyltransferase RlmH [Patescibacteria group bacterium]|jgi:23S rRNA (pseudouridine1915-N3)-methyltransferase